MADLNKLKESLSLNERKVLPYIQEKNIAELCKKSNLNKVAAVRALEYLQNKEIVKLNYTKRKVAEIGVNGVLYKKKGLPERRLVNLLNEKRIISLDDAQKQGKFSPDEFKAAVGVLKKKAMIGIKNKKIILSAGKNETIKKMPEEILMESLPLDYNSLTPEQLYALKNLLGRKDIVRIKEDSLLRTEITDLGKKIISLGPENHNFIEEVTPEILKNEKSWKGRKFRRYDIISKVPEIYGGKRHFVNQAIDYGRKIWTEMGFQEMTGNLIQSSFWNFDALFTAQDHPVREMQDTFFINKKTELSDKKIVKAVKESHESGIAGSKGWGYSWSEEEAKRMVLRTHTTCLSAQTLANLNIKNLPAKFFAIGKCFRNETVDWSHGFEFNQTEGIVVDKNANFRHLLGYLKQFFKKMGFEKIRFSPAYFPYTEPSVEINVWNPEKKCWLELGGAGMFRPEVIIPLLGEYIPVLAWGPGFDRILMDYYEIKDLRELYKNDITKLRKIKFWMK
jgi:phenylalanyl-tRNA synthetase alpha chain